MSCDRNNVADRKMSMPVKMNFLMMDEVFKQDDEGRKNCL